MVTKEKQIDYQAATKKFLCDEANRNSNLNPVDHKAIQDKIQKFIDEMKLSMIVIVDLPDGMVMQSFTPGIPMQRIFGMFSIAEMEFQTNIIANKTLNAFRSNSEKQI